MTPRKASLLLVASLCLSGCGGGAGRTPTKGVQTGPVKLAGLVAVERLVYHAGSDRVPSVLATPRGGPARGCLIWEYGLGSRKEDSSKIWDGAARLGLTTFSIDLPHHGERVTGQADPAHLARDANQLAQTVRDGVADLRRGIDYLEARGACAGNIAYAGISLGGIIGTILAASDHRVRAAVIMSTPATWRDVIETSDVVLPGIRNDPPRLRSALQILSPLDPIRYVGRIAPRQLMILSGLGDPTVPRASATALQAAARPPKTVLNYPGGHDPTFGSAATSNELTIASFLLRDFVEPTYGRAGEPGSTF